MSALLNNCVSCHNAQGLLILALSKLINTDMYRATVNVISIPFVLNTTQ